MKMYYGYLANVFCFFFVKLILDYHYFKHILVLNSSYFTTFSK